MFRFLSTFLVLLPLLAHGQFNDGYTPIEDSIVPESFVIDPLKKVRAYTKSEERISNKKEKRVYSKLFFTKARLLSKGHVYYDEDINEYVNAVASQLLKRKPELNDKISVYVTRSPFPNAFALPDGSVFINIGLIGMAENEAQLAFIIAHEIVHVEEEHSIKSIAKLEKAEEEVVNVSQSRGNLFRKLKYSREHEREADSKALKYMMRSRYAASESDEALKLLDDSLFMHFRDSINYKWLTGEAYPVHDSVITEKMKDTTEEEEQRLIMNEDYGDLLRTHPALDKRVLALKEMMNVTSLDTSEGKDYIVDKAYFKWLARSAPFEAVENFYSDSRFTLSLYFALHLQHKYPENLYLQRMVGQNLYWLAYYKGIQSLENVLHMNSRLHVEAFIRLQTLFEHISTKKARKICYNYMKTKKESTKLNDRMYFYFVLSSEQLLGSETANLLYNKYLERFPKGVFSNFAKSRVQ